MPSSETRGSDWVVQREKTITILCMRGYVVLYRFAYHILSEIFHSPSSRLFEPQSKS